MNLPDPGTEVERARLGTVTPGLCIDIDGQWWHDPWDPKCRGCTTFVKHQCDAADCSDQAETTFIAQEDGELGGRHWQKGDALHYCWPHARKIYNDKDPLED